MSKERILQILRAMYDDVMRSPRNPSIQWNRAEEAHIWSTLYEKANDVGYSQRALDIINGLEMDARGRARDLSVRWTPDEKADVLRLGILFVLQGGV